MANWVQGPIPHTAATATNVKAFTGSTPAGNLVVVCISQIFGAHAPQNIFTVRDNVDTGVNYSLAKSIIHGSGDNRVDIYYKVATSAGTRTITASFGAAGATAADSNMGINEYTGVSVFDANNSNSGNASPLTPGSATASAAASYIACYVSVNGWTSPGVPATWNNRQETDSTGTCPILVIDKDTSGANNPSFTSTTPGNWTAAIATFIAAAGGGSRPVKMAGSFGGYAGRSGGFAARGMIHVPRHYQDRLAA